MGRKSHQVLRVREEGLEGRTLREHELARRHRFLVARPPGHLALG